MARLIGPDEGSRLVYIASGADRGKAAAQGLTAVVYSDAAATTLADIQTTAGATISGSTLTVDSNSLLPLFLFPDGADTVYVKVNGGTATAVYARAEPDDRRKVARLTSSYYVWHRGAQRVFPENSLEAFRNCLAHAAPVIKTDVYDLADGTLGVMHDSTVDRTTTGTGTNTTFNAATWRNLVADAGTWFAPAWSNLNVPMLEDVLREFGGQCVLMLDCKRTQATSLIISAIKRHRLQDSVILTSSDTTLADAAAAGAAGIGYLFYYNGAAITSPTPAAAVAAGATALGIGTSYSDANITSVVASAAALGVPVHGFTVNRKSERDRFSSLGVNVWHCNDPVYVASTSALRTTDQFATGTPFYGLVPSDSWTTDTLVPYVGSPRRLSFANTSGGTYAMLGYLSPLGTTYTVSGTVTFDALDADTSRFAGIMVATDDRTFNGSAIANGYHCIIRETGAFQVFKQTAGTTTDGITATGTSASVSSAGSASAPSVGGSLAWSVAVSATQIVFTVGGSSVTSTDTTFRALPYVHIGKASGNSLQVSYSGIAVS